MSDVSIQNETFKEGLKSVVKTPKMGASINKLNAIQKKQWRRESSMCTFSLSVGLGLFTFGGKYLGRLTRGSAQSGIKSGLFGARFFGFRIGGLGGRIGFCVGIH